MAMRYLARREYCRAELVRKLAGRGVDEGVAREAVARLAEDRLVSDERFAESFARQRVERLYGPRRIRAELKHKGVDGATADAVLAPYGEQWYGQAREWAGRQHSGDLDERERARLYRGGTRRGFTHDQIMRAIDRLRDQGEPRAG